ncbi:hypothetical protein FJT64_026014 [Amphibalanus amphitrite]|uniref:Odorant receptor n=1 Tax=Amphibalanus amphitrite TaxID=1232801 RepID=A0A6A4W6X8_AMPAM|nr:hypothetical protein FJT64_026014 [Amphibalanus amphitrite]
MGRKNPVQPSPGPWVHSPAQPEPIHGCRSAGGSAGSCHSSLITAAVLANGAAIALSNTVSFMLLCVVFASVMWHTLVALVHLVRRRQQLHRLLRRLDRMEEATALCRDASDHHAIKLRSVGITALTVFTGVAWSSDFFTSGLWTHSNYLFPVWLPVRLSSSASFWAVIGVELVIVVMCFTLQIAFDLLQVGLMDAIALFQERLTSLEDGLRHLASMYRALQSLADDASSFCSVPTLSQHASVTFQLLVGLYVTINMFVSAYSRSLVLTFVMFLVTTVLRLAAVSATGSALVASGQRLSQALVGAPWPRHTTAAARFSVQMLVEQTRKPLNFDGYGIFVIQKTTMLTMLSFVLTYFVIMLQMKV